MVSAPAGKLGHADPMGSGAALVAHAAGAFEVPPARRRRADWGG